MFYLPALATQGPFSYPEARGAIFTTEWYYVHNMISSIGILLFVSLAVNILLLLLFLEQRRIITTDTLTGLLNKVGLFEARKKYTRRKNSGGFWTFDRRKIHNETSGAVLYIDLDKFKPVNDKYGHHVGDVLIVEFSKFLKEHIRSKDTPARLHGDEFVVVLQDVDEDEAKKIALNIVENLRKHTFNVHGHEIQLEATVGVAVAKNNDPFDFDALIKEADQAMSQAKQGPREHR